MNTTKQKILPFDRIFVLVAPRAGLEPVRMYNLSPTYIIIQLIPPLAVPRQLLSVAKATGNYRPLRLNAFPFSSTGRGQSFSHQLRPLSWHSS